MARDPGRHALEEGKKKKLTEAGAYLATPHTSQEELDEIRREYESYNAPPEIIEHEVARHIEDPFPLYPEYIRAVRLFMVLDTQWRFGPSGQPMGLEYRSIESALNLNGITGTKKRKQLFEQLQMIERGYLRKRAELKG